MSTKDNILNQARIRWVYIALYYAIAFVISLPFNLNSLAQSLNLPAMVAPAWHAWLFAPAALGPLIAALVCYQSDRSTPRRMSLLGHNQSASILTALVPLVAFTTAGLFTVLGSNSAAVSPTSDKTSIFLITVLSPCLAVLYALCEEVGWRGYLQDAFVPLSSKPSSDKRSFVRYLLRYLLVGVLWWAWHARFSNVFEWTLFPLIVIGSAVLLGRAAEETRSLLVTASMHATIILLTMSGSVSRAYYVAGTLTILGWILIKRFCPVPLPPSAETAETAGRSR